MAIVPNEGKMIRVAIADRTLFLCDVLEKTLESEKDLQVTARETSVSDALEQLDDCDVLLIAIGLEKGSPLDLTRQAVRRDPNIKVVVSGITDTEREALRYIEAGASGYVMKDGTVSEVKEVIRKVNDQGTAISPGVAFSVCRKVHRLAELCGEIGIDLYALPSLTPRERDVVALVEKGFTNQQIADELKIEVGTVKNHIHNILQKYNVERREDLTLISPASRGQ